MAAPGLKSCLSGVAPHQIEEDIYRKEPSAAKPQPKEREAKKISPQRTQRTQSTKSTQGNYLSQGAKHVLSNVKKLGLQAFL
jgi:hypothetical protein